MRFDQIDIRANLNETEQKEYDEINCRRDALIATALARIVDREVRAVFPQMSPEQLKAHEESLGSFKEFCRELRKDSGF